MEQVGVTMLFFFFFSSEQFFNIDSSTEISARRNSIFGVRVKYSYSECRSNCGVVQFEYIKKRDNFFDVALLRIGYTGLV